MNYLDLNVKGWIVDTDDQSAYFHCSPTDFRRWAIKLALMRSLIDSSKVVPRRYFKRLFEGEDLEEWHVFVARAHFKEWRHAFSSYGVGGDAGLGYGWIHASWALGRAVVMAMCTESKDAFNCYPSVVAYNQQEGEPFVEVAHGATELPVRRGGTRCDRIAGCIRSPKTAPRLH